MTLGEAAPPQPRAILKRVEGHLLTAVPAAGEMGPSVLKADLGDV